MAPEHFRSFVVGTAYQLGNLVSSASATIEATIGERFPLPPLANGLTRYDYGLVMAIFMGCVYFYGISSQVFRLMFLVIVLAMIGPEARKKDVIKEHAAEMGMDDSSDFSGEKVHSGRHSDGHAEGQQAGHMSNTERATTRSEDTFEN